MNKLTQSFIEFLNSGESQTAAGLLAIGLTIIAFGVYFGMAHFVAGVMGKR
jgi:hypothetical protein